jgi:predicted small secreted protein
MRIITFIIALGLGLIAIALSSGCETVKGIGKDIEGASTSVQQAFVP